MLKLNKIMLFFFSIVLLLNNVKADHLPTVTDRLAVQSNGTLVSVSGPNNTLAITILGGGIPVNFTTSSVKDIITLGVDHESSKIFGASYGLVEVTLNVEEYNINNTLITTTPITLKVGYDPYSSTSYKDKESYRFDGAYRYVYTVTDIVIDGNTTNELPENLYIEGELFVEGSFDFVSTINQPVSGTSSQLIEVDCEVGEDEIQFSWGGNTADIEYQLEWTFVNNYNGNGGNLSAADVEFDFKHNSTRITTKEISYSIPLIFEEGFLSYRVRAVGTDINNNYLFGVWSNNNESGSVSSSDYISISSNQTHEQNKNWQLTTTFSEGGKKKEVINYADGSGRSRQSVTKINSDNNVIVQETVYDYQGRPAINILPVPVQKDESCQTSNYQPTIQFYDNFNLNDNAEPYTKVDFDIDNLDDNCAVSTQPLSTANGASNYYSEDNPNQEAHQAFLPDAKKFPLTQVEYTPDNTGRIKRQSGVGEKFMLSSGHETKYLYGKPDQIFLDRLFGSEVGYAAHYKKNAVIDANNQASVSYLDQEGRVVATALAGEQDNGLLPLDSETDSQAQLTVDYFEKDVLGVSSVNTINVEGNGIEFSKKFIVITPSDYTFIYDLQNDPFIDTCLRENICFECVYDLKISLLDECSDIVLTNSGDGIDINVIAGKFSMVNDTLKFITDCNNDAYVNNHFEFNTNLGIGTYTISKTLTIHQSAVEFYADAYADSVYNSCAKTLSDFIADEMEGVDTSSCYVTCESCVESLGTKEDFVASGTGSALLYDQLVDECMDPCDIPTLCETRYEQLLIDVSPGGQYGKYLNSNGDVVTGDYWLSVFSSVCYLPAVVSLGLGTELWRIPSYTKDGVTYNYYLDDFGERAKVVVVENPDGTYTPSVAPIDVSYDPVNNVDYTYPEKLTKLSDFVLAWQSSWAKSLVKYHPEYCYYLTCSGYAYEDGNGYSSDGFDNLLLTTETVTDALSAGLITSPNNDGFYVLNDIFNVSSTIPYDPFITDALTAQYGAELQAEVEEKLIDGSISYSLLQVAAIIVKCQNELLAGITLPSSCSSFGNDVDPLVDDQIWNMFVKMYLSAKQTQQAEFEKQQSLVVGGCYNGCIGNENYNLWTSGLQLFPIYTALLDQPCYITSALYKHKIKRFQTADDLPVTDIEDISYQHYLQTGQCPNAFNFQQLLSDIAASGNINNSSTALNVYPSFASVVFSNNNYDLTAGVPEAYWEASVNTAGTQLTANIVIPSLPDYECEVVLDASSLSTPINWNNVIGFTALDAVGPLSGDFEVLVKIQDGTIITYESITGTSCLDLETCNFEPECEANEIAIAIQDVMNTVTTYSNINTPGLYSLGANGEPYEHIVTLGLQNTLGASSFELDWNYDQANLTYNIIPRLATGLQIDLHFLSIENANSGVIAYFSNIQSEYEHYFSVDAYDALGNFLGTYHYEALLNDGTITSPLIMGECDLPRPLSCRETDHYIREDLEELLRDVLITKDYNIYNSPYFSNTLINQLPGVTHSTYIDGNGEGASGWDIIRLWDDHGDDPDEKICDISLKIITSNYLNPNQYPAEISEIIDVGEIVAYGDLTNGSYNDFYFIARFQTANGVVTDSIIGTSCLAIKNCDLCFDQTVNEGGDPDPIGDELSTQKNTSVEDYKKYKQAIDELNTILNLSVGDIGFVETVSYQKYFKEGYSAVSSTFENYIKNYNENFDNERYLNKIEEFTVDYGFYVNVEKEYERYETAVIDYNEKSINNTVSTLDKSTFENEKIAVNTCVYVKYLGECLEQELPAQEVIAYMTDQGMLAPSGALDSCLILYDNYIQVYNTFIDSTLIEYQKGLIFASYEDVIKNGLCCSEYSRQVFREYILRFSDFMNNPGNLPLVKEENTSCDAIRDNYKESVRNFNIYKEIVQKFNTSIYSKEHNNYQLLTYEKDDYFTWAKRAYDPCLPDYFEYLMKYINEPSGSTLPLPEAISNFSTCQTPPNDGCIKAHSLYVNAINVYNEVYATQTGYYLTVTYPTFQDYFDAGLCDNDCVNNYKEYLELFPLVTKNSPPQTLEEFCGIILPPTCGDGVYEAYVQTINDFNSSLYSINYGIQLPIEYNSSEELFAADLCLCAVNYVAYLDDYIQNPTDTTLDIPVSINNYSCATDPVSHCKNFVAFNNAINDYNNSIYTQQTGNYLTNPFSGTIDMAESGFCSCARSYVKYLTIYINATLDDISSLRSPKTIEDYCEEPPSTECDEKYENYIDVIAEYNAFVINENLNWPTVDQTVDPTNFTIEGICYCVDGFIAKLNALISGYVIPIENMSDADVLKLRKRLSNIESFCIDPPCVPEVLPLDTVQPIYVEYSNPCVEQMLSVVAHNAEVAYEQYLQDIKEGFVQNYTKHCLKATENLTATFDDKEYHYTLYYYDQAGNLVRTIPPEGVDVAETTSSFDPVSMNINSDRTYKQRTYFTNHRMPTTYLYNSLNQLVRQDVPDHDKMDIYDFGLTTGLDLDLIVTSVQFVSGGKGYLTGYKDVNGLERGYFYTTSDGGNSWTRITDIVASNLKKVQWIDDDVAYAIGDKGVLIQTKDGGMNWDMVDLYALNVTTQLNDLYFVDNQNGIIVGNNGTIIKMASGTLSLVSPVGSGAISVDDHITAVTLVNGDYIITVDHVNTAGRNYGLTYKQNGTNWEAILNVKAPDLTDINYIDEQNAVAVSNIGLLLKTSNGGDDWFVVETNQRNNFLQVFYLDANEGVAIIETIAGSGEGELYATHDGGSNWLPLNAGVNYTSFYQYSNDGVNARLAAIGTGILDRVIVQVGQPFGLIPVDLPNTWNNTTVVKAIWCEQVGNQLKAFVSSGSDIYYSNNISNTSASWRDYSASLSGISGIKRIDAKDFAATPAAALNISGTLLSGTTLYGFNIAYVQVGILLDGNGVPVLDGNGNQIPVYDNVFTQSSGAIVSNVKDIVKDDEFIHLYQSAPHQINQIELLSGVIPTGTPINTTGAPSGTYNNLTIDFNNSSDILLSSATGNIQKHDGSWTDQTNNVRPYVLNDVKTMSNNELLSVGENGTLLSTNATINTSSVFTLVTNTKQENWNAIVDYPTTPNNLGIIVGDNGAVNQLDLSGAYLLTNMPSGTTQNLNDVAVDNNNASIYIAGNNGAILYTDDIINPLTPVLGNGGVNYKGVSVKPNGIVAYVGDNSNVYLGALNTMYKIKEVFTPKLVKAHFTNVANGYLVGANYTVRRTQTGGQNFDIVLPDVGFPGTVPVVPVLNSVFTNNANEAYIVGDDSYITKTNGVITTEVSNANQPNLGHYNDITFTSPVIGFIVGENGNFGKALKTSDGGNNWDEIQINDNTIRPFKGMYGFERSNSFVAVGENATIVHYYEDINLTNPDVVTNYSNNINPNSVNSTLYDVYFHDDKVGYAVGEKGTIIKTTSATTFDPLTGIITDMYWDEKPITETLLNQTQHNKKDIYAIDFSDRYNGFIGGEYDLSSSNQTEPKGYARLLKDESELFSTYFYYDRLGRLIVSQNSKQFNADIKRYSYTLYDELGRIEEVGEKLANTNGTGFESIFGADVSGHYNVNTIDDDKYIAWINETNGIRQQVTRTYYDYVVDNIVDLPDFPADFEQQNLRKRVATVTYEELRDNDDATYNYATHYTYDIHGNVNAMLQDNLSITEFNGIEDQRFKRLDYNYDLISGNVKQVSYQKGMADAWHHKYEYDADNRLTHALTSSVSNPLESDWDLDAHYIYYDHGPLARVELGQNTVQGIDYAYTLQGWLKGVNSNSLDETRDMGVDGWVDPLNNNAHFGRDAFGFTLGYYKNDYKAINTTKWSVPNRFEAKINGSDLKASRKNLYNGNISYMATTITEPTLYSSTTEVIPNKLPLGTGYRYDRLNRLRKTKAWDNIDLVTNKWQSGSTYNGMYRNTFKYDANGNIKKQVRKDAAGVIIDELKYKYAKNADGEVIQNRLYHVKEDPAYNYDASDIDNMGAFTSNFADINNGSNNYKYDEIGNLIQDSQEGIEEIKWRVDGKIQEIKRVNGSDKQNIKFDYDPQGNRIAKHLYLYSNSNEYLWEESTYYTRDAQGNVMAVYKNTTNNSTGTSYLLTERNIYGSSRVGLNTEPVEMFAAITPSTYIPHTIGAKQYELTNHLGNVLAVVTDKKIPIDSDNDGVINYYQAELVASQDYSPFGVLLDGRTFASESYRYGFNGKEKDDEVKGVTGSSYDFGSRIYDPRVGRFLSVDPLVNNFPSLSPYQYANNSPIYFVDEDGESGVAYKTTEINKATGNPILKVVSNVYLYGEGATAARATAMKTEVNTQYNNGGNYFTADVDGVTYDVVFEINVETLGLGDALQGISEANAKNNYFQVDDGLGVSYTLTGQAPNSGGNTGYLATEDLDKNQNTASHEMNHGFGGNDHPTSGVVNDGSNPDISLPQDQKYTDGTNIDATKREVTQATITDIISKVKFNNKDGSGNVGNPRAQAADPTNPKPKTNYSNVKGN
jgi:RHS repeat-associated protein